MRKTLHTLLLVSSACFSAHAAGFNCALARTPREKAVCASKVLSSLDSQLAANYTKTRSALSPEAAALLTADQREWLAWLDKVCPARPVSGETLSGCLESRYQNRVTQLAKSLQTVDGITFYTRTHFVFAPGSPSRRPGENAPSDPGFGYGEFAWPQIDRPGPNETLWNTAISKAAVAVEGAREDHQPPDLDASVDATGYSFGYYTLKAANHRLIVVSLGISTYGFGAAHPLTDDTPHQWWLGLHRTVQTTDVFRNGTGWQAKLVPLAIAKLQQQFKPPMLWEGEELEKAVTSMIADAGRWTLSNEGLTLTFSQYEVGPYAIGMPSVLLTWNDLAPYLNSSLAPETLPALLPEQN